jgi:ParB/RepB/Spo0J family partition protein
MENTQVNEKTSRFDYIDPDKIAFDESNPRGETQKQIEGDPQFKELVESIKSLGVLDPLIVREIIDAKYSFKLIDGERRLRAALICKKKEVPTHIVDSNIDAKILAYHIHMLRKQWGPVSEVESIIGIIEDLKKDNPKITESEIKAELRKITNHSASQISTLVAISKYDKSVIKKIKGNEGTTRMSHLVQGDQSFISPLRRVFPEVYEKYGDKKLYEIIAKKAGSRKLGKTTRYLIEQILPLFNDFSVKDTFKAEIQKFLDNEGIGIEEVVRKVNESKKDAIQSAVTSQPTPNIPTTEIIVPESSTTHQTASEGTTEQGSPTITLTSEISSDKLSVTSRATPTPSVRTNQQTQLQTTPEVSKNDVPTNPTTPTQQETSAVTAQQSITTPTLTTPSPEDSTTTTNINPPLTDSTAAASQAIPTPITSSSSTTRQGETHVPRQVDSKVVLIKREKVIIEGGVFDLIFSNLREAIIEFEKRTSRKFNNEKELQDFIYSILRCLFISTEFEDPTKKICGTSNRLDFVLRDHNIIIEIKYVRDQVHAKKVSDELAADYLRYLSSEYGNKIINYIYDPGKYITNQDSFRKEIKILMPKALHYIQ